MNLFLDTEFTGLHQNTTLISLGIVSEDGRYFYAEFNDYAQSQLDDWIIDNVIARLLFSRIPGHYLITQVDINTPILGKRNVQVFGNCKRVKEELTAWFTQFTGMLYIWSDCLAYDWMLFCQLFGGAMYIPPGVYYIPSDLCTLLKMKGVDPDISRMIFGGGYLSEELLKPCSDGYESSVRRFLKYRFPACFDPKTPLYGFGRLQHNSLFDALTIKACYDRVMKEF